MKSRLKLRIAGHLLIPRKIQDTLSKPDSIRTSRVKPKPPHSDLSQNPSKSRADPLEDTHQQRLHGVRPDDTPARPQHTVSPKLAHDEYEFQHGCGNGGEELALKKKLLRAWCLNERCLPEPD